MPMKDPDNPSPASAIDVARFNLKLAIAAIAEATTLEAKREAEEERDRWVLTVMSVEADDYVRAMAIEIDAAKRLFEYVAAFASIDMTIAGTTLFKSGRVQAGLQAPTRWAAELTANGLPIKAELQERWRKLFLQLQDNPYAMYYDPHNPGDSE